MIEQAWTALRDEEIVSMQDLSPGVSTNYVYRILLQSGEIVYAKWSRFGKFEHFVEDHEIIAAMQELLPPRYTHFLTRTMEHNGRPFIFPSQEGRRDSWVAFYYPIEIKNRLPKRLNEELIGALAHELAYFHLSCSSIARDLPQSTKSTSSEIEALVSYLETDNKIEPDTRSLLLQQCDLFLKFNASVHKDAVLNIPVFVDWNIGNFSVTDDCQFYSRWDYDWFRMTSRMMDFYFFARVVSDVGDRSDFTYEIDVMQESRFKLFIKKYHQVFPLSDLDLQMLPQLYRFFLLNYVIKFGNAFFKNYFAKKLELDVLNTHFSSIDDFDWRKLKSVLS